MTTQQSYRTYDDFQNQIINYHIVDQWLKHRGWGGHYQRYAHEAILAHPKPKIDLPASCVPSIKAKILSGERRPDFPTIFTGKLVDRRKKDLMYSRFFGLLDGIIPKKEERRYIGLTAEQIAMYCSEIKGRICSCEIDPQRCAWMRHFHEAFLRKYVASDVVKINNMNVFDYLLSNKDCRANVLDLDLMCCVQSLEQLQGWAYAIHHAVGNIAVINIATAYGRQTSTLQYAALMPWTMVELLKKVGFKKVEVRARDTYTETSPMAWEHFLVEK